MLDYKTTHSKKEVYRFLQKVLAILTGDNLNSPDRFGEYDFDGYSRE